MRKIFLSLLFPGGLIAGLAAALFSAVNLPPAARSFLPFYPVVVLAAGLLLGWRFNRSRLIFALLLLALADRGLVHWPTAPVLTQALQVLLPLNLALIASYAERGLLTWVGLVRLGLLGGQAAVMAFFCEYRPAESLAALGHPLLPSLPPFLLSGVAVQFLVLVFLLGRFLRQPTPLAGGFVWALFAACLPLFLGLQDFGLTLGFATAGLILLAAVIETSHGMAFCDELTGLPARRALNESLLKVGRRYTVAMVDIDHFKKVNDRFGHDTGDQVLRMVAAKLGRVGGGGRPFRYGGEEFTILFPGKALAEALPYLEAVREAVQATGFTVRHPARPRKPPEKLPKRVGTQRLGVTVSIGVAGRQEDANRPAQVIKAADQALYRAKKTGRNRVCSASDGEPVRRSSRGN